MFYRSVILYFILLFSVSCSNNKNSPEFIQEYTGRYLYNSDEVIEVYFKEKVMFIKWRGAEDIQPLKTNDSVFFVKEMNEKITFKFNNVTKQIFMCLVPKESTQKIEFNYKKLSKNEKVPSEYLSNNQLNKAINGYLLIQQKDSLDPTINEVDFNRKGYALLRKKEYAKAIDLFIINTKLYPNSSNVYDSLGEAYLKNKDTANAIVNYKKSLSLDSANARAKRVLKNIEKIPTS